LEAEQLIEFEFLLTIGRIDFSDLGDRFFTGQCKFIFELIEFTLCFFERSSILLYRTSIRITFMGM